MNKASFEKILEPLNNFWQGLDKSKKIRIIVLTALIIIIAIISTAALNHKEYAVLYNNMESGEAGEVLAKLKEMKVVARAQGDGTILVPKEEQDSLRMQLSSEGYPKSSLNYDVFQKSTGFGTTEFEKQKYLQFQLQERLQNSIKTLDVVEDAIVTLNIADNNSFVLKEDKQKTSASVILKLKNKNSLTKDQIRGIEGLVAKSVPGLTEDQVLMIDSSGNSLKSASDQGAGLAGAQLELESSMSEKLQKQILTLLEPVFGTGKVTAGVRVALDYDKQTTESITYNPNGTSDEGIPVSTNIASEESTSSNQAGTTGQDPNGAAPQYAETDANGGQYKKVNKTINYEINQTKDTIQKAEGKVKDITVSVILDEKDLPAGSDEKVKELVAGAVGIAKANVTVQSMAFNGANEVGKIFDSVQQSKELVRKQLFLRNSIIFGILGLMLLLIFIFAIRPFMKKGRDELADKNAYDGEFANGTKEDDFEFNINKSEKREFIEKSIEKNPELVAQLLRNWLNDDMR